MKTQKMASVILACMTLLLKGCSQPVENPDPYQVYSDLLRATFLRRFQRIVLSSETASDMVTENDLREHAREGLAGLRKDTIRDFFAQNQVSVVLTDDFAEDLGVVLLPEEKSEEIAPLNADDWWQEFYKLYPESQGITDLSRVGFSRDGMQALVYIATHSGFLDASGRLVLLKHNGVREGESWRILDDVTLWVS